VTKISELGFDIVKENEIMMPHPLKEYLWVGCVTMYERNEEGILREEENMKVKDSKVKSMKFLK
jgi:hypothetical protein